MYDQPTPFTKNNLGSPRERTYIRQAPKLYIARRKLKYRTKFKKMLRSPTRNREPPDRSPPGPVPPPKGANPDSLCVKCSVSISNKTDAFKCSFCHLYTHVEYTYAARSR